MREYELSQVIDGLIAHLDQNNYKGYDPYDALLMPLPWPKMGKWPPIVAIQILKRLPINIRPFVGIRKDYNPKAMGLFLQAFCNLYAKTGNSAYLQHAHELFNWLKENHTKGYSGICWGYNFPWASPLKYLTAYSPSSVVTGFVCKAVFAYYKLTKSEDAKSLLLSSADFVLNDIPLYEDTTGISYSYTTVEKDINYNASLLAAEILTFRYHFTGDADLKKQIVKACAFVTHKQKEDGSWYYSENSTRTEERRQIDFHQGFILDSLFNISQIIPSEENNLLPFIIKGAEFYRYQQFYENGRAKFRLPEDWPVDIHHLAQGIISFSRLSPLQPDYQKFASKITDWTIENMISDKGFFYYRRNKFNTNKLNFIRWSQAWMLLALSEVL